MWLGRQSDSKHLGPSTVSPFEKYSYIIESWSKPNDFFIQTHGTSVSIKNHKDDSGSRTKSQRKKDGRKRERKRGRQRGKVRRLITDSQRNWLIIYGDYNIQSPEQTRAAVLPNRKLHCTSSVSVFTRQNWVLEAKKWLWIDKDRFVDLISTQQLKD